MFGGESANPSSDAELKALYEEVGNTAEEFYKLYYDTVDKKRHLMGRLYLDTAVLVWDGNPMRSNTEIQKFYENLPTTTHQVNSMDAQPVSKAAVPGSQKTILIQVEGNVRIQSDDKSHKLFCQNFTITAHEGKWKIVTDCFRLIPDGR